MGLANLLKCPVSQSDLRRLTLREKCQYSELFWSAFSRIRIEYGEIRGISPYSVQMQENADENNSEQGHLLCSLKSTQSNTESIIRKNIPGTGEANTYKNIQRAIFTELVQDIFILIFKNICNVSLIKQGSLVLALILE